MARQDTAPQNGPLQQITEMPPPRGYQQEMLDESLRRNIIIALDTGSGKTLIAVLRMKHEMEREPRKLAWFFAPTVALCDQQKSVIQMYLPVSVGMVSGANEPDQWKNAALWERVLSTHRIVVSTPQVFLDALRHGYISLGRDISLLVFDEAHHAVDNHPYNRIMLEFYQDLPPRTVGGEGPVRPMVLGLTASPIYGGDVEKAFKTIETNLDCTIRAPRRNRAELATYVHPPIFKHIMYQPPEVNPFSTNLAALDSIIATLDIEHDPYVKNLRSQLSRMTPGSSEHTRTDQKLSKVIAKQNSFTHKGLADFQRAAYDICADIGAWAADWFVWRVIDRAKAAANPYNTTMMMTWKKSEKAYLLGILEQVVVSPVSYYADDIADDVSAKTRALIECVLAEQADAERAGEAYSCIVFVQRRDAVLALAEVLRHHPRTAGGVFSVGTLQGTSDSSHRHAMMDITRSLVREAPQDAVLAEFKSGAKNLIISTAVAEEGIDIQACGSVVRWDLPPNMASWAQSKGRARKRRSTFTMMFEEGSGREDVDKWVGLEMKMREAYNDPSRDLVEEVEEGMEENEEEEEELEFRIESTGACLTLHSAISHVTHFCAVIPNSTHVDNSPLFDLDPPEFPEGWHFMQGPRPAYTGPYGSTVTLPRTLPLPLAERTFTVPRIYSSSISAHRHAAFLAYRTLYEKGLLNDRLLPMTSVIEPELEDEVKALLAEVEKREGLARVRMGIDPWAAPDEDVEGGGGDTESETWHAAQVHIQGLAPLWLFTRAAVLALDGGMEGPTLYRAGVPPTRTSVRYVEAFAVESGSPHAQRLADAREWTRMLFWGLNSTRMQWDNMEFSYFFLPTSPAEAISFAFDTVYSTSIDAEWSRRRRWLEDLAARAPELHKHRLTARADEFGAAFGNSGDVTFVQRQAGFGRPFKFVRWQFERLTPEEEERVQKLYQRKSRSADDMEIEAVEIEYPVLVVQAFPPRSNFLIPIPEKPPQEEGGAEASVGGPPLVHLLARYSGILLFSPEETEYAFLLPSVLRFLSMRMTAFSLHKTIFSSTFSSPPTPLDSSASPVAPPAPVQAPLPLVPLPLLTVAITAPVSGEQFNYQRMETLGDTVLKFICGINVFAQYPLWHEGYLTQKKDHAVSNVRLAKEDVKRGIYRWIIRDIMMGKRWKPQYVATKEALALLSPPADLGEREPVASPAPPEAENTHSPPSTVQGEPERANNSISASAPESAASASVVEKPEAVKKVKKKKKSKKSQELSTKVLADVIESIIGAAYLHGGFDLGYEYIKFFDLGIQWEPLPFRITQVLARVDIISTDEFTVPAQLADVERMLGYTFQRKLLLIEALTHASYQQDSRTPSYERMEFLGDSVLDMVVTDFLYRAPGKNYSPGHMHLRKSALVNAHILSYFCLKTYTTVETAMPRPAAGGGRIEVPVEMRKIHLWKCLLHSSPKVLEDQLNTATRFRKWQEIIETSLLSGNVFPWAALTRLQAPKFFSDMIESVLGAVFLDSGGSFPVVREVLTQLGILPLLERVVADDVDILHPVSRLSLWASKHEREIKYEIRREGGKVSCTIVVDGIEEAREEAQWRGKPSQEEVKYNVAEQAIKKFKLRDVGVAYEEMKKKKAPRKRRAKHEEDS